MKYFKFFILLYLPIFLLSGCMMATRGMGGCGGGMMGEDGAQTDSKVEADLNSAMDGVIDEVAQDLSNKNLGLKSVAIWGIESNNSRIHSEMLEDKLVIRFVRADLFKVVDRKKLKQLLEEQTLNLSGAIDDKTAKEVGKLVGVDGFFYGTASIHDEKFIVDFKIINSESGVIVWGREAKRNLKSSSERYY